MKPSDFNLELVIGRVLRTGVLASSACLLLGLLLTPVWPEPARWWLNAGILLLLLTPAARVVVSFAEYVMIRDWFFTAATGIVLLELLAGAVAALLFHRRI